jgi:hypothetical protein
MEGSTTGKPMRPEQIAEAKNLAIPGHVFDAFNTCITKTYTNGRAQVYQKDVVAEIAKTTENPPIEWLDVEEAYRENGWDVQYDKPAYCESYRAFFIFSKKGLS